MDIRFLTSIEKNTAYCLLKGSESGSFACLPRLGLPCLPVGRGHRSPVLSEVEVSNQPSNENKAPGMIADNQNILRLFISTKTP
ncbi:MAG: hypothetical protein CL555_05335 [Algoriphagus sp.]|nr:hypothetical protein [Algoriphagus sp.]